MEKVISSLTGLSILIPTFNYVPQTLLNALLGQVANQTIPIEIIIGNDGSSPEISVQLHNLAAQFAGMVQISSAHNQGRAGVRNRLAQEAAYSHLLFIDADSEPKHPDFLAKYISFLPKNSVLVGGTAYKAERPAPSQLLRWVYGCTSEQVSAAKRNLEPFKSLTINNLCLPKAIFQQLKLHDTIMAYGHEDTLFGFQLQQNKIIVLHLDNQVYHLGLETSEAFLTKSAEAAHTLAQLVRQGFLPASFTKLSATSQVLQRLKFVGIFLAMYKWVSTAILASLLGPKPNLSYFKMYKLAAYLQAAKRA